MQAPDAALLPRHCAANRDPSLLPTAPLPSCSYYTSLKYAAFSDELMMPLKADAAQVAGIPDGFWVRGPANRGGQCGGVLASWIGKPSYAQDGEMLSKTKTCIHPLPCLSRSTMLPGAPTARQWLSRCAALVATPTRHVSRWSCGWQTWPAARRGA